MKSTKNISFDYMFNIHEGIERFIPSDNEIKWK